MRTLNKDNAPVVTNPRLRSLIMLPLRAILFQQLLLLIQKNKCHSEKLDFLRAFHINYYGAQ